MRRRRAKRTLKVTSSSYRIHPAKRKKPGPGTCTWCKIAILRIDGTPNLRRTFCSNRCVTEYLLRTDPKVMRRHIFFRDEGKCAHCGEQHFYLDGPWEADHIEPLMLAFDDPSFWEPENLQILCKDPCHKAKTQSDRIRYGFARKLARGPQARPKRVKLADRM